MWIATLTSVYQALERLKPVDELAFIKNYPLKEENHFASLYSNKRYSGWYKHVIYEHTEERVRGVRIVVKNVYVMFRLPEILPIYETARRFSYEERLVGIHRMMVGEDLKNELENLLKQASVNDYFNTLSDEDIKNLLGRGEKIVTLNCNKVPYLSISYNTPLCEDLQNDPSFEEELLRIQEYEKTTVDEKIKKYITSHPDYVDIFINVLNKKISIDDAEKGSNGIMTCEFRELLLK